MRAGLLRMGTLTLVMGHGSWMQHQPHVEWGCYETQLQDS